jgi:hypothetical protein
MSQALNRMIAAMHSVGGGHSYKYDGSLRKKGVDPDALRGAFYSKSRSVENIYDYEVQKSSWTSGRFDDDGPPDCEYIHVLDGATYFEDDIPYDPPEYYETGVTKIYSLSTSPRFLNSIMMVNYNPSNGKFIYVMGNIEDSEWSGMCHHRSDLSWNFSEEKDVDFISMYLNYANILKDFIDDVDVGSEALINYIKDNN